MRAAQTPSPCLETGRRGRGGHPGLPRSARGTRDLAGGRIGSLRHLLRRGHAVRGRLQHRARAVRRLQRAALPGQARLGRRHDQRRPARGRRLRQRHRAGRLLRAHHLRDHRALRPVRPGQQPDHRGRRRRGRGRTSAPTRPRCRSRSAATRSTASTSPGRPATGTTAPPGSRSTAQPEGMYMVASGTHVNSGCCFDFGNAETNTHDNGAAHMDAVNLTTYCEFSPCSGQRPLGRGRHGERPVRERERQQPERHQQQQRLRHRGAEEQRADDVRAQGRQRAVRRPVDVLERVAARAGTRRCTRRARSCSAPAATTATPRSARSSRA